MRVRATYVAWLACPCHLNPVSHALGVSVQDNLVSQTRVRGCFSVGRLKVESSHISMCYARTQLTCMYVLMCVYVLLVSACAYRPTVTLCVCQLVQ